MAAPSLLYFLPIIDHALHHHITGIHGRTVDTRFGLLHFFCTRWDDIAVAMQHFAVADKFRGTGFEPGQREPKYVSAFFRTSTKTLEKSRNARGSRSLRHVAEWSCPG